MYWPISGTKTSNHLHKYILTSHKAFGTSVCAVSVNKYSERYFGRILLLCGGTCRLLEVILDFVEFTSDFVFYSSNGKSRLNKTFFIEYWVSVWKAELTKQHRVWLCEIFRILSQNTRVGGFFLYHPEKKLCLSGNLMFLKQENSENIFYHLYCIWSSAYPRFPVSQGVDDVDQELFWGQ